MKRPLPRMAALAVCLALLFSLVPPQPVLAAGGDGTATYRALLIGNANYDGAQTLRAPLYDAAHIEQLLLQQDFSGDRFDPANIIKLTDATKLQILETIRTELAGQADGDDVTYVYYSGHGTFEGGKSYLVGVEMAMLSVDELKAALDAVPGRKVVLLDCCYAGGFAGKAVDVGGIAAKPAMKFAGGAPAAAESALDGCAAFQAAALRPFEQPARPTAQRALTTAGYQVIAAASPFQYSFEYKFNTPGALCYGPLFRMNGVDFAGGLGNWSGEFTGMLVAGAGRVSFSDDFPEIRALADGDRDRSVTLDELYRYLRGAVLNSTVQVYPEGDLTVLFQHSAADAPDWGQPVLRVEHNDGPHAPAPDDPLRLDLTGGAGWPDRVEVRRSRMIGDNATADNAAAVTVDIAEVSADGSVPDGAEATLYWDAEGAGDGWYFAGIATDAHLYPPVPFELGRGVSNFPSAAALPVNASFTANPAAGTAYYAYTPPADGLLVIESACGSGPNPEAELYDAEGNSLAWNDDRGDGLNFRLVRVLKAGRQVFVGIRLNGGSGAIPVLCRFATPAANNRALTVDMARTSYTLFRPDVSGQWTVRAQASIDDDVPGIALRDAWMNPVAWGERSPQSYRYLSAYLEAGQLYVLETPKANAAMTVAAYGPGKLPALATSSMPALTMAGAAVHIARAYETKYFKFTPSTTGNYRFYSDAPVDGGQRVDSYAFLTDGRGAVLASDDDVNYGAGYVQFDFTARLSAGSMYVLAVRAYVQPGQISSSNASLDFSVYVASGGAAARTQAVASIAAAGRSAIALYDDDGDPADGIGAGGFAAGWGVSEDGEHDGSTGLDFGEGLYALRRWFPQLLYAGGNSFTDVWAVGHAYAARDADGGTYAWGVSTDAAAFGVIRRLDNPVNGLLRYDIKAMAQGAGQSDLYFLDGKSGKIFVMEGLGGKPRELPAPAGPFVRIASSESGLFALDGEGRLYAMGPNRWGECGTGAYDAVSALQQVALPEGVMDFAAGAHHALALTGDGQVYAWGRNDFGNLGLGRTDRKSAELAEVPLDGLLHPGERVTRVFAGGDSSAALTSEGRLFVWGANDFGQLGIGGTASRALPVEAGALSPGALGGGRAVAQVTFTEACAYAVIDDGSVYVSGCNDGGQLGFISGTVTKFTPLSQPDLRSSNCDLLQLTLSAGRLSPAFSPDTFEYGVVMPPGVALSTITAAKADASATLTIDGQPVTSRVVNAGPGPVRVEIAVTAENGDRQTYALNFPQSPSANADLASLGLSGGCLLKPLNGTDLAYSVVIPETVTGPVTVAPVAADPNSTVAIDGDAGLPSKAVALSGSQPTALRVDVTAQQGNARSYTFTIARKPILASATATPVQSGYGSLSPGGTNRLAFRYTLNCPATVKIELKKGSAWVTLANRAESAGARYWAWDGRVNGSYLATGSYSARITPYYGGRAGVQRSLTVRVLPKPSVTIASLYPSTFTPGGTRKLRLTFRWSVLSDVKAEIITQSGAVVKTLHTSVNKAPGSLTLYWDGKNTSGSYVRAGYYKVRITCGGRAITRTFRLKR